MGIIISSLGDYCVRANSRTLITGGNLRGLRVSNFFPSAEQLSRCCGNSRIDTCPDEGGGSPWRIWIRQIGTRTPAVSQPTGPLSFAKYGNVTPLLFQPSNISGTNGSQKYWGEHYMLCIQPRGT